MQTLKVLPGLHVVCSVAFMARQRARLRNMVDRCAILSTGVTLERHVEIEDWTPGQHVPDSSSGSYEPVTLEEAERIS